MSAAAAARETVLVVDDDATTRQLVKGWLEQSGMDVLDAAGGEHGLRLLRADPRAVSVIVLDVMMPGMDGYQFLEQLGGEPALASIPVLLLTAHATGEQDVVRGFDHGALDHMTKPFSGRVLVARVRALCRKRRAEVGLRAKLEKAESQALTDPLTHLGNRRAFQVLLDHELSFARRHREALAVAMMDIDHFKVINDRHGHPEGDRVLVFFAERLRENLRGSDRSFRVGGEEFALVLRATDARSALVVVQRLSRKVRTTPCEVGAEQHTVTFSAGVAAGDRTNDFALEGLVERADRALYRAKQAGRDRVEIEASES